MDRRAAKQIGTAVSKAIESAGREPLEIAEAVGLTSTELDARLAGDADFSSPELVMIGGLVAVPASHFFAAAAA